jgi:hypothetical protein
MKYDLFIPKIHLFLRTSIPAVYVKSISVYFCRVLLQHANVAISLTEIFIIVFGGFFYSNAQCLDPSTDIAPAIFVLPS